MLSRARAPQWVTVGVPLAQSNSAAAPLGQNVPLTDWRAGLSTCPTGIGPIEGMWGRIANDRHAECRTWWGTYVVHRRHPQFLTEGIPMTRIAAVAALALTALVTVVAPVASVSAGNGNGGVETTRARWA